MATILPGIYRIYSAEDHSQGLIPDDSKWARFTLLSPILCSQINKLFCFQWRVTRSKTGGGYYIESPTPPGGIAVSGAVRPGAKIIYTPGPKYTEVYIRKESGDVY
ncbi:hypothetical protein Clacol_005295 [Clathrus columnatus]|uniref:Uncharacterized protein n=1 Tax=Clathrus columnatus TaxID=1419009 RepID=A0AAV5AEC2_9AGAM|nr:hypothetical protein Clacol_005295 [Clathrus columnatus]